MNKNSNYYVKNFYFFVSEDLIFKNNLTSIFKPNKNHYSIKTSTAQIKSSPENIIIIKDSQDQQKPLNFEINESKKIIKEEIKEHIPTRNTDISEEKLSNGQNITIELDKDISPKKNFIFITASKKQIGRKPKTISARAIHTKFSHDNILRKIKVKFIQKIIVYINGIIIMKYSKVIGLLKKLKGTISQNNGISFNQKLLNSRIRDVFCENEINGKYKSVENNYNRKVIEKIYEQNITELIDILEMTFLDAFNAFRETDFSQNKLNGMEKIDKVIEEMKRKEKNEDYINTFKDVVMNFEKHYFDKNGRK